MYSGTTGVLLKGIPNPEQECSYRDSFDEQINFACKNWKWRQTPFTLQGLLMCIEYPELFRRARS
jgi:hypothetical protein